jgi:hypothetical protein
VVRGLNLLYMTFVHPQTDGLADKNETMTLVAPHATSMALIWPELAIDYEQSKPGLMARRILELVNTWRIE